MKAFVLFFSILLAISAKAQVSRYPFHIYQKGEEETFKYTMTQYKLQYPTFKKENLKKNLRNKAYFLKNTQELKKRPYLLEALIQFKFETLEKLRLAEYINDGHLFNQEQLDFLNSIKNIPPEKKYEIAKAKDGVSNSYEWRILTNYSEYTDKNYAQTLKRENKLIDYSIKKLVGEAALKAIKNISAAEIEKNYLKIDGLGDRSKMTSDDGRATLTIIQGNFEAGNISERPVKAKSLLFSAEMVDYIYSKHPELF